MKLDTFDNFDNTLRSQNTLGSQIIVGSQKIGVSKFIRDLKTVLTMLTMLTTLTIDTVDWVDHIDHDDRFSVDPMEESKLSDLVFLQWDVRSSVLKTPKKRKALLAPPRGCQ